jgi:beta-lactamase regulating signal transducer with metallopeptidase domain/DNA gyrase inhibitor GyrI
MIATINEWSGLWWGWMAPMFWQASLLVLLIGVLDWAVRRWVWPQVRYAVWLLVLLKLVLPPTLASSVSVFSRIEPGLRSAAAGTAAEPFLRSASSARPEAAAAGRPDRTPAFSAAGTSPAGTMETADAGASAALTLKTWAFLVWIGGMAVFALLLILKMARLRRWHRLHRNDRIPDWFYRMLVETAKTLRLGRVPAIVFAPDAATPAVYGMFRPVLLLPSGYLKRLSREEARHVLLHELSHLKRGDLWAHGLYLVLHVVYWFNPLLIWARRQMKHVREICCDLSVAGVLREKTRGYRDTLLNTAKDLLTENVEPGLGLLGVFEEPFRLVSRLKWLEKDVWKKRRWIPAASVSASLCVAAAFLPMAPRTVHLLPDDPVRTVQFSTEGPVVLNVTEDGKAEPANFRIRIETTRPRTAVLLARFGRINPQIEGALTELKERMKEQGLKPRGEYFFRVWTDGQKVPDELSIWEVGCPVSSDADAEAPLEIARIPELREAVTDVRDMLTTVGTWKAFVEAVQAAGLVPAFPPAVETFRDWDGSKPFWRNTEMRIQALRPGEGYPGLDVQIRETKAVTALTLPMSGPLSQFDAARDRMKRFIRENDIKTTNRWFRQFYSNPSEVTPDQQLWEIGCELAIPPDGTDLRVDPPFSLRHMKKDSIAFSAFRGPLDTEFPYMPFVWQVVFKGHMIVGALGQYWEEGGKWGRTDIREMGWFVPVTSAETFAGQAQAFGEAMSAWAGRTFAEDKPKQDELRRNKFENQKAWTDRSTSSDAASGTVSGTGTVRGYRVQLVSTTEEKIAQKTWNGAMSKLKTPVYLIFEPPIRMIRIGDCRTLEEAEILMQKAVKSGFPKASIVRSDIAGSVTSTGNEEASDSGPGWQERLSGLFSGFSTADDSKPLFRVESTNPYWAVLLPASGSMVQQPVVFEKLLNTLKALGIQPAGTPFTRQYYSVETVNQTELQWEAGFPVADSAAVKPPFKCERVPVRNVVRIHYRKGFDQKTFSMQMAAWAYHNQYRILHPQVLIWTGGIPEANREPERLEAELPVERMKDPYPQVEVFFRSDKECLELILPCKGDWKGEDEAIRRLESYIRKRGIETLGDVFIQYHFSPEITPAEDLVWDVGVPIKGEVKVEDPYRIEWRHGRQWACANYTGDHLDIPVPFWWSYSLNFTMNGYAATGYPRKAMRERQADGSWKVELLWGVNR